MLSSRVATVARVSLADGRTVVVKHCAGYGLAPPHEELLAEMAAYRFLETTAFTDRPALLGRHPRGLLVLEDLGEREQPGRTTAQIGDHVAVVLARLHEATAGRPDGLRHARAALGLPDAPDARAAFDEGAAALDGWAAATGVAAAGRTGALLAEVAASLAEPRGYGALLHDDLVNGRQCVIRDGRMLLLDYERARYGHALLDVAKVLVGKFERDLGTRAMVYACPRLDPSLAEAYRAARGWDHLPPDGPAPDDAWAAAVVFTAVAQVADLLAHVRRTTVEGGLLPNVSAILARASYVLAERPGRPEVRAVLDAVLARVPVAG